MKSLLWLLTALSLSTFAADDEGPTPCDSVETKQQAQECSAYNRTTAEQQLKEAYDELRHRAQVQFSDRPTLLKSYLEKTAIAQNLWRNLRDADCAVQVLEFDTSDSRQSALNDCMAQHSDERSEYLQSLAWQAEEAGPDED